MAVNLPLELFYQIALYLPSTKDVLAFALTHSRVRRALSTPALFKGRLALQGWDLSAWQNEGSNASSQSPPEDLERWMRIDHIYCRTVQLFDEAAADNYFSESPPDIDFDCDVRREPESEQPDPGPFVTPQSSDQSPVPRNALLNGQKAIDWLRKLSEVLPVFLTHHRGGNVSRITEARHRGALLNYARVLCSICAVVPPKYVVCSVSGSQAFKPQLATSEYAWFERICFCLVALLIQCDTNTVTSIFSDSVVYTDPPFSTFRLSWAADDTHRHAAELDLYTLLIVINEARQRRFSEHYFSTFLIQAMISMALRSDPLLPLRAPSLSYIKPAASFSYDESFGPKQGIIPSSLPLPPPRPWLRNRLAGTPLAELLSSADGDTSDGRRGRRLWAGYYTVEGDEIGQDPPMFLELYPAYGPIASPSDLDPDPIQWMDFRGEGHDSVGTFTLGGSCHKPTGEVMAIKTYTTHEWKWQGMVTPFGMAGIWGLGSNNGWWWIWPREWSNNSSTTASGPD